MGRGPFPTTHAGRGGAHQPPFLQQQYPQQQQPQYPGSNQQHHSNTTTNSMAYNHGGPPPNNLQQQQLPVMRAAPMAATSAMPTAGIVVSKRQQGNPVLKYIRNVSWQFGDIGPDYLLGQNACALFLSLRCVGPCTPSTPSPVRRVPVGEGAQGVCALFLSFRCVAICGGALNPPRTFSFPPHQAA